MHQRILRNIGGTLVGVALFVPSVLAGQLLNGTIFFNKSPRLLDAVTTFDGVRVWAAKYYFTVELPQDAGVPLQKLTVQQRNGLETIRYRLEDTIAFAGTPDNRGNSIVVKETTIDPQSNTISIIFETPISPGTTFTAGLKPKRNPEYSGIYLFGVTAYPAGEQTQGLYLGVRRLQFYQNGDRVN